MKLSSYEYDLHFSFPTMFLVWFSHSSFVWVTLMRCPFFVWYFNDLFNLKQKCQFSDEIENMYPLCISEQEQMELCKIPEEEEIKRTLCKMHNLEVSRKDRLAVVFYKKFWNIVG